MNTTIKFFTTMLSLVFITSSVYANFHRSPTYGGNGGRAFTMIPGNEFIHIKKISIRHSMHIDKINVVWSDPRRRTTSKTVGGNGGKQGHLGKWSHIYLSRGEYITSVQGYSDRWVNQITIYTNKGKKYGPYGRRCGKPFYINTPRNSRIIGFAGRSGAWIDQIGAIYKRVKVTAPVKKPLVYHKQKWRTVFSFNEQAKYAYWDSYTLGNKKATYNKLTFGKQKNRKGNAELAFKVLEDRSRKTVLFTHPKWTKNGAIRGAFPKTPPLPANARLEGKLGFEQVGLPVKTSGAKFSIFAYYPENGQTKTDLIYSYFKRYNGKLETINVDLSKYAGKRVCFELRVIAGNTPTEDWAIWDNLIIRARQ